jgi:hypothetical protein
MRLFDARVVAGSWPCVRLARNSSGQLLCNARSVQRQLPAAETQPAPAQRSMSSGTNSFIDCFTLTGLAAVLANRVDLHDLTLDSLRVNRS